MRTVAGAEVSQFINLNMPSGSVSARLSITPDATGVKSVVLNGIYSVTASGVNVVIPASLANSTNLPASLSLELSNDSGVTWKEYADGRVLLSSVSPNETVNIGNSISIGNTPSVTIPGNVEVSNDSGSALPVSTRNFSNNIASGSLTTIGQTVAATVGDYAVFTFYLSGTFSGANVVFEQSPDGTTWFQTTASALGFNSVGPSFSGISSANAYEVSVAGASQVRIRLSGITSGTVNVVVSASSSAAEPAPAIATHPVTQSGSWTVSIQPANPTLYTVTTAATTNAASVKSSGGAITMLTCFNNSASTIYIRIYNKTTAPTVGTDVPVAVFPVAAGALFNPNFGVSGLRLATGIAIAVTGAAPNNDSTAAAAGVIVSACYF